MRGRLTFLVAVVPALGACSAEPPPAAVEASDAQPDAIEPGLWTINRNLLSQKIGDRQIEVAMTGDTKLESKCLAGPVSEMIAIQFMTDTTRVECRHDRAALTGGKVDAALACTPPPTHKDNVVTASGDYGPTHFELTVQTKATAVPPGEDIEQRQVFDGRRTGSC